MVKYTGIYLYTQIDSIEVTILAKFILLESGIKKNIGRILGHGELEFTPKVLYKQRSKTQQEENSSTYVGKGCKVIR